MLHRCLILSVLLFAAGLMTVLPTRQAEAYPEPAIVSRSWQLEFTYERPRPIAVRSIDGDLNWYWYMIYEVQNHSGEDRLFIPEFTVYTSEGAMIEAGRDVPPNVYERIQHREGRLLMVSPIDVIGRILQGEDRAKQSVAIWPAFEGDVDWFRVFVAGLSGETQGVPDPVTGDRVVTRKSYMINFNTPGTVTKATDMTLNHAGDEWIMR